MRASAIPWILALAIAPGGLASARAGDLNFTSNTPGEKRVVSCSDIDMRFWKDRLERDGIVTARRDRTVALRADPSTPLKVKAPARGVKSTALRAHTTTAIEAGTETLGVKRIA